MKLRDERGTRHCAIPPMTIKPSWMGHPKILGEFGQDDAGDSCVVVEDAEIVPVSFREECADGIALAEADFESEKAVG